MNAILGAVGKDDIGVHFPDTDPHYRGIASAALLVQVLAIMRRCGFAIVNVDVTVLAQEPRLAPFFLPMRENIARLTKIAAAQVNIKAATTEALGWIGQSRGMMATAVVLLAKNPRARRRNS
jgi:2-C-methyl-D-erythritol 2,4-cyclodiphosphate synthase